MSLLSAGRAARAAPPDWGSDSSEKPDDPPPKREPSSSTEELGYVVSDLETSATPFPLWFTVLAGTLYPYQALALGFTLEYYAAPWLRLEGTYALGWPGVVGKEQSTQIGNYGEALVGAAILRVARERQIQLIVHDPTSGRPTTVDVPVPTYHGLFVELGSMTGFIQPSRCAANCEHPYYYIDRIWAPENHQLFMLMGGIRYVYFWAARSHAARTERHVHLQVYFHLIGGALNPPKNLNLYDSYDDRIERSAIGGRFGLELPPPCVDCRIRVGMSVGYNPLPAGLLLTFHLGI